jgi:hypothetical protein
MIFVRKQQATVKRTPLHERMLGYRDQPGVRAAKPAPLSVGYRDPLAWLSQATNSRQRRCGRARLVDPSLLRLERQGFMAIFRAVFW